MKPEIKGYKKSTNTKDKLTKAFFSIYKTTKIEDINVKEITDKAGYNRGTFYIYFKSVYDLLKQTENELFLQFQAHIKELTQLFYNPLHAEEIIKNLATLFDKYDKYIQVLLGDNGDPLFQYQIKSILKKAYIEYLGVDYKRTDQSYKYVLEYMTQANISTISFWLSHRKQGENFGDIIGLLYDINSSGPHNILAKKIK